MSAAAIATLRARLVGSKPDTLAALETLERERAALIADLTAITEGLELHLTTPGAPLHGDAGTRNFVTRARATLATVQS
jgi:hypothetical protein